MYQQDSQPNVAILCELLTERIGKNTTKNTGLYYKYNQHINRLFILLAAVRILTITHSSPYLTTT